LYGFNLSGTIIDYESEIPISNANIEIPNSNIGLYSDFDGKFLIDNLNEGNYDIHFSHIGFENQTISINIPQDNKLYVKLRKVLLPHNPVMVTGLHIEKPLSKSPIITEIISRQDIERYSSSTVLELLEQTLPNIQISNNVHGTTMKIQGLDSKYFLFLLNGNRMTGETTGNIDFSRLNTANIERVEILNGGASTSYGSGAIGGVINIITENNNKPFSMKIGSKFYSKNNDNKFWVIANYQNKYFKLATDLNNKSSLGYDLDGLIIQNKYNDLSINNSIDIKFFKNIKLNLSRKLYTHDTEDYNLNNKKRDKYYDKQFILNCNFFPNSNYRINLNWNNDKYDKYTLFEVLKEERIRSSHILNLVNLNSLYTFNKNNNILLGFEHYNEQFFSPNDLEYNPTAGYLGDDTLKNSSINSIYFQTDFNLLESYHFISGVRYDYNELYGTHIGPHISGLYKYNNHKFRINVSKNFKSPTLKELYMSWDHLGMFYVNGNKDLLPETSKYYSLSYEFSNYRYNFTLKPYINILDNMIYSVDDLDSDQMIYKNYKSVNINGLDIYFKITQKYISYNSTFSFSNPKDISNNIQLEGTNKFASSNNIIINLLNDKSHININYKYIGPTYYQNSTIAKYYVVNFSYNFNLSYNIDVTSGIDNLINTTTLENRKTIYPNKRYFLNLNINLD